MKCEKYFKQVKELQILSTNVFEKLKERERKNIPETFYKLKEGKKKKKKKKDFRKFQEKNSCF